jgi:hypothetical protein
MQTVTGQFQELCSESQGTRTCNSLDRIDPLLSNGEGWTEEEVSRDVQELWQSILREVLMVLVDWQLRDTDLSLLHGREYEGEAVVTTISTYSEVDLVRGRVPKTLCGQAQHWVRRFNGQVAEIPRHSQTTKTKRQEIFIKTGTQQRMW